jgi:hypothetical protein
MVRISGKRRRDVYRVKRDIDDFRVTSGKLESYKGKSYWLEDDEKVMFDTDTEEVRIR